MLQESQGSMLSQPQGPLLDNEFILNNRPVARPQAPLTTCSKEGKAAAAKKRKPASNKEGTKEGKATAKKTKANNKKGTTAAKRGRSAKKTSTDSDGQA
jgi:hypothetical protein